MGCNSPWFMKGLNKSNSEAFYWIYFWNEPPHDKTNIMICSPSEDSDELWHPPSLIRVFAVRMKAHWDLSYPLSDSEDSVQAGRMPRLIWVFAGRTGHFVGFVMRRLKWTFLKCINLFMFGCYRNFTRLQTMVTMETLIYKKYPQRWLGSTTIKESRRRLW